MGELANNERPIRCEGPIGIKGLSRVQIHIYSAHCASVSVHKCNNIDRFRSLRITFLQPRGSRKCNGLNFHPYIIIYRILWSVYNCKLIRLQLFSFKLKVVL